MNDIYIGFLVSESSLSHHGIKGMKWGVRRFQKKDGSLISAGKHKNKKSNKKNTNDAAYRRKVMLKTGAAAVAFALGTYGGYKLSKHFAGVGMRAIQESDLFNDITSSGTIGLSKVSNYSRLVKTTPRVTKSLSKSSAPKLKPGSIHLNTASNYSRNPGFKNMTYDDLKKLDLW